MGPVGFGIGNWELGIGNGRGISMRRALFITLLLGPPPLLAQGAGGRSLAALERSYDSLRYLRDQIDVTRSRDATTSIHGVGIDRLVAEYEGARSEFGRHLSTIRRDRLRGEDRRAFDVMKRTFRESLGPDRGVSTVAPQSATATCDYDPTMYANRAAGMDSLEARMFACYSQATQGIVVNGDTLDRLSILSLLRTTEDRSRRERLFRGLDQVWTAVNRHDEPGSPYRQLLTLRRRAWAGKRTPIQARPAEYGLAERDLERWLTAALESWRAALPDTLFEPWDYFHFVGTGSRRLARRIPLGSLSALNRRFYSALGAPPESLGVRYDMEPRPGKYPIAFTTFGGRSIERDGSWRRTEPWVFTYYRVGGLENLAELLHETGHAIHIAAIRARPALHDWPDSDSFTEGIADLAAWEIYEPAWQQAYLGDSVPRAVALRDKYSGIMLDMAWSLFEIRAHRDRSRSPNEIWADITGRYFKIRPHPELSWWAMRGQLIEAPGYLINYALGAFVVADLRAEIEHRYGDFSLGRASWYRQVSDAIYRFGLERSARQVTETFLGRPVSADGLLRELRDGGKR